ncbi:Zinc finger, FYVE/PHD-type [Pseudocohnilembus persalinus]|uniref:Zinc finger, FYVE/PHD-type n=1 Tax=Pseudocohnilembus persalinus TaxID=266149 RepID=A0A0V0Q7R4_PSEPJ|nr:Zinc finger, FYVE/PHD-type [Pseudocohnilembus persalinus]|eukprot:KRW98256.1 Zinc finger, FYVE/PHD-type [Pseudocohnilembus persalinus]
MNSIIQFQKSEKEDDYLQSHKLQQHLKNLNSVLIKEQNKYVMKTDEIKDYIKKQKEEIYKRQNQQYSDSDLDTNKSDMDEEEEDQEIVSEHDSHSSPINYKEQSDTNNNNTYSHKSIKVTKKIKKQKNDLDKMLKKEQQQQHHKQKKKMSINSITYSEYSSSQKYNTDNKGNKDFGKTCFAENCQNKENYDDKVLFCQGCKMGFHSKCLNLNFWLAQVNSSQSPWKCKKCKECEVCHKKIKSTTQLEFQNCKLCDRPYHIQCMTKKERSQLQKEGEFWCCGQCRKCPNCLECKNCKENKECNNKKTKCNNVIWVDMDEEKCEQARQKKRNCDKCWERHKKIYNQDNSYDFCFLCMKIHKRGSSKSCKCHGCEAWVHTRCDPNAEEYFRQHKNLKHQVYYCPQCNIIFNQTGKKREIQQVQIDYDSDSENQG